MPVLAAAERPAAAPDAPPAPDADRPSPWNNGERLHQASIAAAALGAALAGILATRDALIPAVLCLVGLIGLNVSLGVLWERLPRVLGRSGASPALATALAWTSFGSWQAGVALTALAWGGFLGAPLGALGGFLLLSSAFLLIQDFALRFWRAPCKTSMAWRGSLALLVPAAISMAAAALLFAISFDPAAIPQLPHVALSLLVFGAMLPAGLIAIGLSEDDALDELRLA